MFVVSLFEDQPLLVDASGPKVIKSNLPSAPKRNQYDEDEPISDKQAAQDAKQTTTVSVFTASGDTYWLARTRGG